MVAKRVLLVSLVFTVLSGCMPAKPLMKDTPQLAPGTGVMVARLAMPYLLRSNHLPTRFEVVNLDGAWPSSESIKVSLAETFIVLPLAAGTYQWKSLRVGAYYAKMNPMEFNIVAGRINYVGDFTVILRETNNPSYDVYFRVYDYHEHFLPVLAAQYPKLWNNYPVTVNLTHYPSYVRIEKW